MTHNSQAKWSQGNDGFGYHERERFVKTPNPVTEAEAQFLVDIVTNVHLPKWKRKNAYLKLIKQYGHHIEPDDAKLFCDRDTESEASDSDASDSGSDCSGSDGSGSGSGSDSETDSICPSYQLDVAEYFQRTINQMQPAAVANPAEAEAEDVPRRCTWRTIRLKEMPQNPTLSHEAKVTDIVQDASAGMQEDRNQTPASTSQTGSYEKLFLMRGKAMNYLL